MALGTGRLRLYFDGGFVDSNPISLEIHSEDSSPRHGV
jgi:hypothetical protein